MNDKNERVSQSIVLSYASVVFSILTGLLYTPWLMKSLGTSDYAIYSIAISIMSYFTIDFGIGASITRFIARYRAENTEHKINQLLGIALKIYLIIDIAALVILTIIFFKINKIYIGLSDYEIDRLRIVFVITAVMITCCIPVMPINGVFIAFGRVYNVKLFDLLQKALTVGVICVAIIIGRGLYAVVFINACTTISVNVVKLITIWKKEHVYPIIKAKDKIITHELLAFSAWVAIAMIADKFFFSFEPTLLGIFSNTMEISIFAVAAAMEGYVLTFADGLNGVFLPRVTKMVVKKDSNESITSLMIKVGRLQMFVVSIFIIGIATQGFDFISIWFGKEYSKAYYASIIILLPCMIHLTESIATEMIYATNNVKYRALAYSVSSLINVIITAILAPKFGAIGAAIGISIGFLFGHEFILNIIYAKVLNLDIKHFFMSCHCNAIPALSLMVITGFLIREIFPVLSRLQILLRVLLCGVIFALILYFLFLNDSEKKNLSDLVHSVTRKVFIRLKNR